MTTYGYMLYTFRVHRHGEKKNPLPLGNFSGRSNGDALVVLYGVLRGMESQPIHERSKHLRVLSVEGTGRCIRFDTEIGTSGQTSTFRDPAISHDEPVFERETRHIEAGRRRGLLVAPTNSAVGILAIEAWNRSTGRELLTKIIKQAFRAYTDGLIIDFDAIVDDAALRQYLAQAEINAITLRRTGMSRDVAEALELQQPDADAGRLELTIKPGGIRSWQRQLAERFRGDDEARRRLLQVHGIDFSELNVRMSVGKRQTTLSITADRVPSFVYHLSSSNPLPDNKYYAEVLEMIPDVAPAVGMIVSGAWQAGDWSQEATNTLIEVEVPDNESAREEAE